MRWIIAFLVSLPISLFAANGDISGVAIETNGWQALVYVSGLNTNGTFAYGWSTNATLYSTNRYASFNNLTTPVAPTPAIVLTLSSPGYDDAGSPISVSRNVYATRAVRNPSPNDAFLDTVISGSSVKLRVALSDYVWSEDTSVTASILANVYTENGTNSNAANSISVTNNSIYSVTNASVIANWSWPGWQRSSGSSLTLKAVAFQRYAQLGRPIRAITFTAADNHSHTATKTITGMAIDHSVTDAIPFPEYTAVMDLTGFTQNDPVRCDFTIYPWIGASISTANNLYTGYTPLYSAQTNLCDINGTYGSSYAVVDPANGVDATGVVGTNTFNPASPPSPFLTINGALVAIKATNNAVYSHSDVGGATCYLTNGTFTWTGGSGSYTTVPKTWVTFQNYPGVPTASVVIGGQSGVKNAGDRLHFKGVTFGSSTASTEFDVITVLWTDQCVFLPGGNAASFYRVTLKYDTGSTWSNPPYGPAPPANIVTSQALLRGSSLDLRTPGVDVYCVLGNSKTILTNVSAPLFTNDGTANTSQPQMAGGIVAFNKLLGVKGTGNSIFRMNYLSNNLSGFALVQNLVEVCAETSSQPIFGIAADSSTSATVNNYLIWNNTMVGERQNGPYNESGTTELDRWFFSMKNNCLDCMAIKTDTFGTASGNRIGNWPSVWGVGNSGNFFGPLTNIANFPHWFCGGQPGVNSVEVDTTYGFPTTYQGFVSRQAQTAAGANNGAGSGNYRFVSSSPLVLFKTEWLLPVDMEGNARGLLDPPGAYASACPRKGAGFFAP